MECKFVSNGLAIDYFGTVKPCCVFSPDQDFRNNYNINSIDLSKFHQSHKIIEIKQQFDRGIWPKECCACEQTEKQGRGDSIRLNAENSYSNYSEQDITLEIRGGSVCNFACQTCWPHASTRVAKFYQQSSISFQPRVNTDWDFEILDSIKHRLKDIVLLGGEPFYDKKCLTFLDWLRDKKISANLIIFTNGSILDKNFLENYLGKITLVFSIDAVGRPAEYIRFGTEWDVVERNYNQCKSLTSIETRINITTSPYNYYYLPDLMKWICKDWPSVVSFGIAGASENSWFMDESVYKPEHRIELIEQVNLAKQIVQQEKIEPMQKINALNALQSICDNLESVNYVVGKYDRFKKFICDMDKVKSIKIQDYCPEVAGYFDIK